MNQTPYRTLNEYYRQLFGQKTAKISLDANFTCPNRDGTIATGGCIFCSPSGSGDFAADATSSIELQIQQGKQQTKEKWADAVYIAYFQAYTNTYAPVARLRSLYEAALKDPQVVGISIATRPDCLESDVLSLLDELSQKTTLWVELGLQTANPKTASFIRRGYENDVFVQAVYQLHALGIAVVVHVILGLPEETEADILETIDFINRLPIQGVKLQLMHVLKGTDLAVLYQQGAYAPLEKNTYLHLLCRCIARLRPDIVLHRVTGDGDRKTLLAPLWSLHKRDVLNCLQRTLRENNIQQGEDYV